MNMSDIAKVLVQAKKYIPEPVRIRLCYMFATMLREHVNVEDKTAFTGDFLYLCDVGDTLPAMVAADICIQESKLSEFCNKWLQVTQFREPDGDWTPITPDMNSLRVTMVKELEALTKEKA